MTDSRYHKHGPRYQVGHEKSRCTSDFHLPSTGLNHRAGVFNSNEKTRAAVERPNWDVFDSVGNFCDPECRNRYCCGKVDGKPIQHVPGAIAAKRKPSYVSAHLTNLMGGLNGREYLEY